MILVLTAIISFGLMSLALGVIASTMRQYGFAILMALAGERRFELVQSQPRIRRVVRFRERSVSMAQQPMRAAA